MSACRFKFQLNSKNHRHFNPSPLLRCYHPFGFPQIFQRPDRIFSFCRRYLRWVQPHINFPYCVPIFDIIKVYQLNSNFKISRAPKKFSLDNRKCNKSATFAISKTMTALKPCHLLYMTGLHVNAGIYYEQPDSTQCQARYD